MIKAFKTRAFDAPDFAVKKHNKAKVMAAIVSVLGLALGIWSWVGGGVNPILCIGGFILIGVGFYLLSYFRLRKMEVAGWEEKVGVCIQQEHKAYDFYKKDKNRKVPAVLVETDEEIIKLSLEKTAEAIPEGVKVRLYLPFDAARTERNGIVTYWDIYGYEVEVSDGDY